MESSHNTIEYAKGVVLRARAQLSPCILYKKILVTTYDVSHDMVGITSLTTMEQITNEFRKDIVQADGSRVIQNKHDKYMKTIHFDIPNLDYDVLCEIPRFLVRTTIFPSGSRYGNADQSVFRLWMAEIANYLEWDFEYRDKRFCDLFGLLIGSHFLNVDSPKKTLDYHFTRAAGNFHILHACFSFPFLERCIRYKCYEYVNEDGVVKRNFSIPRYGNTDRLYTRNISNISHEMKLLYHYVATPKLKGILQRFMDELNEDTWLRLDDPYELIKDWRNRLLHGENIWSSGLDVATYLICLILMSYISPDEYNSKKEELKRHVKWKQNQCSAYLWYLYPL